MEGFNYLEINWEINSAANGKSNPPVIMQNEKIV